MTRSTAPLALAGALILGPAAAEPVDLECCGAHVFHKRETPPLAITTKSGPTVEVFRLDPGGCLIGPLTIKDRDGVDLFRLPVDTDFPEGCARWPRRIIRR